MRNLGCPNIKVMFSVLKIWDMLLFLGFFLVLFV